MLTLLVLNYLRETLEQNSLDYLYYFDEGNILVPADRKKSVEANKKAVYHNQGI